MIAVVGYCFWLGSEAHSGDEQYIVIAEEESGVPSV